MTDLPEYKTVLEELYTLFNANGYITYDQALNSFFKYDLPLKAVDSITDHLLSIGIIFRNGDDLNSNEDEIIDRTRTNYENIYSKCIRKCPDLVYLIDYIKNINPPQAKEWKILLPQAQNGNLYARDRLFDMYLRVVVKIALRYSIKSNYEIEDLIQEGALGLLQAIKAYDFSKHGSFVTYMPFWISQYISRAISDLSRTIRIPVHMLEKIDLIEKSKKILKSISSEKITITEIAEKCKMTEELVKNILRYQIKTISIEDLLSIDDDGYCSYDIEYFENNQIIDSLENYSLNNILNNMIKILSEKEAKILYFRYGFNNGESKTLEEVGEIFGLTRERIRQIENRAIEKLKNIPDIKKLEDFYYLNK